MWARPWGLAVACVAVLLLGACGNEAAPVPTATNPAPPAVSTAPLPASPTPKPTPRPDLPGTPLPGEITVGQLADRIAAAWPSVRGYRVTQTTNSAPPGAASPVALPPPVIAVDEVVPPDRHRRTLLQGGVELGQVIRVGDRIWMRGSFYPGGVASPEASAMPWRELNQADLATPSPLSEAFAALLRPEVAPYSQLSEDERGRIARPLGPILVDGHTCDAFAIPDATLTGERVEIVLALEPGGLPCLIRTTVGASRTESVFAFDVAVAIEPPA